MTAHLVACAILCILAVMPAAPASVEPAFAPARGRDIKSRLVFDGVRRDYVLHIPPGYDPARSAPLVIALHGCAGDFSYQIRVSGLSEKSDRQGFLLVCPNGTGRFGRFLLTWNAGSCCGWSLARGVDDVGFIDALIDHLGEQLNIDPRRIYATGFSNGAMLAYQLACRLSQRIAAIAPVGGSMSGQEPQPSGICNHFSRHR